MGQKESFVSRDSISSEPKSDANNTNEKQAHGNRRSFFNTNRLHYSRIKWSISMRDTHLQI